MFPVLKVLALILTFLVTAFAEGAPALTARDQASASNYLKEAK